MSMFNNVTVSGYSNVAAVCPVAPPGAQAPVDELTGYVLYGVIALFAVSVFVLIGCIVGGIVFRMSHAAKGGLVGLVGVMVSAIGYLVVPGMLDAILGSGCVG